MSTLNGKKVALDISALQALCDECMSAIDAQEDEMIQRSRGKDCDVCRKLKVHVPELMELRKPLHDMNELLSSGQVA